MIKNECRHAYKHLDQAECLWCEDCVEKKIKEISKIIFKGIINKDCRDTAVYYRNELIKIGLPKDTMKYGIFKDAKGETHVVLFVDVTKQLFKHDLWHLMKTTPGLGNIFAHKEEDPIGKAFKQLAVVQKSIKKHFG